MFTGLLTKVSKALKGCFGLPLTDINKNLNLAYARYRDYRASAGRRRRVNEMEEFSDRELDTLTYLNTQKNRGYFDRKMIIGLQKYFVRSRMSFKSRNKEVIKMVRFDEASNAIIIYEDYSFEGSDSDESNEPFW